MESQGLLSGFQEAFITLWGVGVPGITEVEDAVSAE